MTQQIDNAFETAQKLLAEGKVADAEKACDGVLELDPRHARANHMRGSLYLARNKPDTALSHLQISEELGNDHHMLPFHLGLAHAGTGNQAKAASCFKLAEDRNPELAEASYHRGVSLLAIGKATESLRVFENADRLSADNPAILGAWGNALMATGHPAEALKKFDAALDKEPDRASLLNNKALALKKLGETEQALACLWRAYETATQNTDVVNNLADCLSTLDDNARALQGLEKLSQGHPDNAFVGGVLAHCLERGGQLDEAEEVAWKALESDPSSFHAQLTIARCSRRSGALGKAEVTLSRLLEQDLSDVRRVTALKEYAQVLDRLGRYEKAFANFTKANDIVARLKPEEHDPSTIFESVSRVKRWLIQRERHDDPEGNEIPPLAGAPANSPIFFVGFPRSGTTLLETILKAHPRIVSADERAWVRMTMEECGYMEPDKWASMSKDDCLKARRFYWQLAERVHGTSLNQRRLLDKMPFNIVHLGFINRIFPEAKVLMAIRDPRDCVLSAFMQNFARVSELRPFLTLETGARYYNDIMGLWLGYRSVLKMDYLEFHYESVIDDPEATLKQILIHVGEPWDDSLLRHHEIIDTKTVIRTPSARDVSESVYRRAAHRWRNYADEMEPVIPILRPYIDAFGYD